MKRPLFSLFATSCLLLTFVLVGCDDSDDDAPKNSKAGASGSQNESSGPTETSNDSVALVDPVESAFTVEVPKGWFNKAYSTRIHEIYRQVVTSVSPNSDTVIFFGDPNMPQYWDPASASSMTYTMAKINPMQKVEAYSPASAYFADYATRKFGKLEDFKVGNVDTKPEDSQKMLSMFQQRGVATSGCEVVDLFFSYKSKGKDMSGMLHGTTINFGSYWLAFVGGISTEGDPLKYKPMLEKIGNSLKISPEWTAKQTARHEAVMAQIQQETQRMTERHNANMQWIQDSAQRHQQRMQAIWAQGDASMNAYYARSASSDLQHQNFLNYINDENTVVNSSGKTFQVDNNYDRYYMNKNDSTKYVGGDIRLDQDKLRTLGLNPDDYEEVKIRKSSGN